MSSVMNRLYSSFLLFFLFGLFGACTREPVNSEDKESPVVTLRAKFMGNTTKAEFGAITTTESYSQVWWSAGDALNVFFLESSSSVSSKYTTQAGGETATFALTSGNTPQGSSFFGLSPYNENATANFSSNSIQTFIPIEQHALSDSFDPAALLAVASSSNADQMAFYNVCSGLRFTLMGPKVSSYRSIEFVGNSSEKVAGPVNISCSSASAPVATAVSNSSKSVSLLLPEGATFEKGKTYYILFRPGEFPQGFTLTFKDESGTALVTSVCSSYVEFKRSTFASINGADVPENLDKIRDGELLSETGTANSYIVSKAGSYKFLLARAGEEDILSGISDVKVLWETDNTVSAPSEGSIINSVTKNRNFVYFKTPDTIKNGNALIAAYRGNDIVWSWHIWVCKGYDPSSTKQKYSGKNYAMMDRNLGALSTSATSGLTNGLFYQWGRKDPFPGAAESFASSSNGAHFIGLTNKMTVASSDNDAAVGSVDYAIAHPTTFITTTRNNGNWLSSPDNTLWAQSKSVYDPCPAGWRVPAAYVLDSSKNHISAQEAWTDLDYRRLTSGSYGVYLDGGLAWYPNNGYISLSGSLLMVGQYSCYWSNSPQSQATYAMEMSQTPSGPTFNPMCYGKVRGEGHSVRCVEDK